jgi:hypothetical protein
MEEVQNRQERLQKYNGGGSVETGHFHFGLTNINKTLKYIKGNVIMQNFLTNPIRVRFGGDEYIR